MNTSKPLKGIRLNWVAGLRFEMRCIGLNYFHTINNRTKSVKHLITLLKQNELLPILLPALRRSLHSMQIFPKED